MLNTPPTFAWYMAGLVLKWLKAQGGLAAMGQRNRAKAKLLYQAIDGSGFYRNPVATNCRSWMNVPFTLADPKLDHAVPVTRPTRRGSPISKAIARSVACARVSTTRCRSPACRRWSAS